MNTHIALDHTFLSQDAIRDRVKRLHGSIGLHVIQIAQDLSGKEYPGPGVIKYVQSVL